MEQLRRVSGNNSQSKKEMVWFHFYNISKWQYCRDKEQIRGYKGPDMVKDKDLSMISMEQHKNNFLMMYLNCRIGHTVGHMWKNCMKPHIHVFNFLISMLYLTALCKVWPLGKLGDQYMGLHCTFLISSCRYILISK
jgi:hypothetical protein